MNRIDILVSVDALGAAASGSLRDNVYLVDTAGYLGSWGEGTDTLHTVCQDGQRLSWAAASVSPSNDVEITGFSGTMVSGKVCAPTRQGIAGAYQWQGMVQTRGLVGQYDYVLTLTIDGRPMSFSPYIKVV